MNKKQKAVELDASGYCIACQQPDPKRIRGLCPKHHKAFIRRLSQCSSSEQKAQFEALAIESGLVLEDRRGQRVYAPADPYLELLSQVLTTEQKKDLAATELDETSAMIERATKPKKPPRKP